MALPPQTGKILGINNIIITGDCSAISAGAVSFTITGY
jgi:hypothetical protein